MSISTSPRTFSPYGNLLRPALAAVALMACAAVAYAATNEPTTTTEKIEKAETKVEKAVSDSWITTKVKSEILANSAAKAFKVSVTTKSGVVSLKGTLPTQDAADLVQKIAEGVQGVHSVDVSGLSVKTAS
ncbi:BON domain-containing protein [Rhodoferax saidenbachensis]|uniref:Hyperosmotically inducible protein n=1 Tax=Rhodoferax saidenbachensis TaxID=1484693 RepID=A0ABU1ZTT5_9BURK|nr:BON domain-containing protein [Rhodoferax saidenbachensis]MDR7308366.1 hyperosmotically inducible protein [Rhodoferax saidenbachensis]